MWRLLLLCLWMSTALAAPELRLGGNLERVAVGPHIEFLRDPGGMMRWPAVRTAEFRELRSPQANFGFTRDVIWLRFTVVTPPEEIRPWLLEIAYPPLDYLEVYVDPTRALPAFNGGDRLPFDARLIRHPDYLFPLALTPGQPTTVYVRVQSESSISVPLAMVTAGEFEGERGSDIFVFGLFFGSVLALVLFNLALFLALRDSRFVFYVMFLASTSFVFLVYDGLAYQFLWPDAPNWNNHIGILAAQLTLAFSLLFARSFLETPQRMPRTERIFRGLIGVILLMLLISSIRLDYAFAAQCFSIFAVVVGSLQFAVGVMSWRDGYRPARYFVMAWAALLSGILLYALRVIGLIPASGFAVWGVQIGAAVEMGLLSLALVDRVDILRRDRERAQEQALVTAHQVEHELEQRVAERVIELKQLNQELAHEVAERRRVEEQMRHLAHHDPLTGLANRRLLSEHLQLALAAAKRHHRSVGVMLLDLDNFKLINDAFGHDAGDDLLQEVATRLSSSVRECDTVARLGGDEFVVLLGELHDITAATVVAEKILASLAPPFVLSTGIVQTTPSIGVALYPEHAGDEASLLKGADDAMYAAKSAGKNTYRIAGEYADNERRVR